MHGYSAVMQAVECRSAYCCKSGLSGTSLRAGAPRAQREAWPPGSARTEGGGCAWPASVCSCLGASVHCTGSMRC